MLPILLSQLNGLVLQKKHEWIYGQLLTQEFETHSNLMYPNIGVGGYCLTKDPLFWQVGLEEIYFGSEDELEVSVSSVSINDQMPLFAYQRLKSIFGHLITKASCSFWCFLSWRCW